MTDIDDEPAVINIADDNELPIDDNEQAQVIPEVVLLDDELPAAEQNSDGEDVEDIGNEAEGKSNEENEAERETNPDDEDNPFADDVDSDEEGGGVQVTIRKIETTDKPMVRQGKLDLDTTAMINQKPIYDLDLAQMEDRPWRKPGADITDYFNYGFTEETWNMYCERQKKLRIEFSGNQKAANEALLSTIKMSNPLANPIINNSSSVVKVLTDNGGRFKPSHNNSNYTQHNHSSVANEQVIRTVISGTTSSTVNTAMPPNPLMDFTRPPPGMNMPPIGAPPALPPSAADAPPGVEADRPPGVEPAPGTAPAPGIGGVGVPGGLDLGLPPLGIPPLGFNPNLPPPGMPPMGLMSTSMPPPGFSMPPPAFQQHSRAGFGPGPVGMPPGGSAPRSLMASSSFRESDEEEERRTSRRKRSRSRSPRRSDRERESRRRGERDSERTSSRRHRSRSASGDRRRRRDDRERDRDREKRRDRRDDDDRKKKSRRDDDDDRRESKKEKSSKIRVKEEPPEEEPSTAPEDSAPVE